MKTILSVRARLGSVPRIRGWARQVLAGWGVSPDTTSDLLTAVTEVCTNVIRHGYEGAPGEIRLAASKRGRTIRLTIEDDAASFVPEGSEAPAPERLSEGGYGLSLIHAMADEIRHEALGTRGNRTTLVKREKPRRTDR